MINFITEVTNPRHRSSRLISVTVALLLSGCAAEEVVSLAPVCGVVTQSGNPVANAMVEFFPSSGRASVGRTEEDGSFVLHYSDSEGAVIGSGRIQVTPGARGAADEGTHEDVVAPPMKAPPQVIRIQQPFTVEETGSFFNIELNSGVAT